jgi:transposase
MGEITTIGVDLAKNVFQLHGVTADGSVALRRQVRRSQVLEFFARLPPCLIGMEACAGAHFWARELTKLGHEVRLMPPSYVKPYVKRGKTDAADAGAIAEAVTRPSMRFVPVKTEVQQAVLMMHRTRDFLVRQLTQVTNAIRAHLAEFGIVVPKGVHNVERLLTMAEDAALPDSARNPIKLLAEQFRDTFEKIEDVTVEIRKAAENDGVARRLQTIPGVGPITSSVLAATVPDVSNFKAARDLAAWIGLTPKPHSSGGKERLGKISKMGNRYIRRLLYLGAMATIMARRRRPAGDDWLWGMMQRKPVKLVAIALANRIARTVWALLKTGESYRASPG